MTEDFIYYLWKYKFLSNGLRTCNDEALQIISPGQRNSNSGPDFLNAKIKIGSTIWAGNVEVHIKSSDWFAHHHQNDEAYTNIILHVVYENDKAVYDKNGVLIPTLEIKGKFRQELYERYRDFLENSYWTPCQNMFGQVSRIVIKSCLERMLVERLERKSCDIYRLLNINKNNWEETFYQVLASNFGFRLNEQPFLMLAKSLPLKILAKHKNNLLQIEALLFGQAGLLHKDFSEQYPLFLKNEYNFLRKKYSLKPAEGHLWKFLRLRPSNFPTIRISQFAHLIYKSESLLSKILSTKQSEELFEFFLLNASTYWDEHYVFEKKSVRKKKKIGKETINLFIINSISPFLFLYGKHKDQEIYREKALNLLSGIKPEKNSIIRGWIKTGFSPENALESQALLELKKNYCDYKRCLDCRIGTYLLKNVKSEMPEM